MVLLLDSGSVHQAAVSVQDRFRESGRSGRKINCGEIIIRNRNIRFFAGTVGSLADVILGKARAVIVADIVEQAVFADLVCNLLDTADKFRTEDQNVCLCQLDTVFDLIGGIAEVQRNCDRSGF